MNDQKLEAELYEFACLPIEKKVDSYSMAHIQTTFRILIGPIRRSFEYLQEEGAKGVHIR